MENTPITDNIPIGTQAHSVVMYFLTVFEIRARKESIARYINQAKSLIKLGYTVEEIKMVIDRVWNEFGSEVYSFGFINTSMERQIAKIKKEKSALEVKQTNAIKQTERNITTGDSSSRNQQKLKSKKRNLDDDLYKVILD